MAPFKMRAYRDHDQDAEPVMAFLSRISRHPRYVSDYHIGDFVWNGYPGVQAPYSERLSIWESGDGQMVAVGWFEAPKEFALTIDPALFDSPEGEALITQMVAGAEERYAGQEETPEEPFGLTVGHNDAFTQRVLTGLGFRFSGETWYAGNFRTLDGLLEQPRLPEGYEIVEMTDGADLVDRVEIHREVWAPSKRTLPGYLTLRRAPVYRQDLDLCVQAPDGRYACYLIAWWDPEAKSGLLEPVGAREAYRRLGLTKALIQEALRRLQALGATRAYVNSEHSEVPANALYRAAGFRCIVEWQWWTKSDVPD